MINLIDPCINPDGIVGPSQTDPDPYSYEVEPLIFNLNRFESVPPGCEIRYTCVSSDFFCEIPGVATFDGELEQGTWTFQTLDLQTYKPGTYTM